MSQNVWQFKMFPSESFSSNYDSFNLVVLLGFEGECGWVEVVSLTEEYSEFFVSKL